MVGSSARPQATRYRRRAVFIRKTKRRPGMATSLANPDSNRAPSEDVDEEFVSTSAAAGSRGRVHIDRAAMVPAMFKRPPLVQDHLQTDTSELQEETVLDCFPFMSGQDAPATKNDFGVPHLDRARHVNFLHMNLRPLPGGFVGYDASRPWFLYWCLNSLVLLGEDIAPLRDRVIETAHTMQNPSGGFGGGHGQASHLATTYAVVLALALLGDDVCYETVDRRGMWKWLCRLKQPDGGFQMSVGGEEDVRGAYCASVIISLLQIPLSLSNESPAWTPNKPTLFTGLAEYVQRCQTYEGGISSQPGSEAHGGYAFCALGCLSILDSPDRAIPRYLNVPRLVSWLASRQYAPEGGFSGRTNKLVDGCYSHWVGDCWPLVEACLSSPETSTFPLPSQSLFCREGLIRYILCCCQDETPRGGLRDKPGKMSDAYHTCYVLSGLSSAQHKWELKPSSLSTSPSSTTWTVAPFTDGSVQVFDEQDRVNPLHPVYTIAADRVEQIQAYFAAKAGF